MNRGSGIYIAAHELFLLWFDIGWFNPYLLVPAISFASRYAVAITIATNMPCCLGSLLLTVINHIKTLISNYIDSSLWIVTSILTSVVEITTRIINYIPQFSLDVFRSHVRDLIPVKLISLCVSLSGIRLYNSRQNNCKCLQTRGPSQYKDV